MDYNVSFVGGNDVIVGGEVECFVQEVLADGWIELFNVKTDEAEVLFVFDRFEPVDYGCGVFPLIEAVFFRDCAVDAVEDLFADFAYLGLRGVDESAGLEPGDTGSQDKIL